MSPDPSDKQDAAIIRRLLLGKQLFRHGIERSKDAGIFHQLIAVHNLHNATEIALKAICIHHEVILKDSINFPELLNAIDKHQPFKEKGWQVPLKPQLLLLNRLRNQAQHDALPPSADAINECCVLCEQALKIIYSQYFGVDFDEISPLSMINDTLFRTLMELSLKSIEQNRCWVSLLRSRAVFELASHGVLDVAIKESFDFGPSLFRFRSSAVETGVPSMLIEALEEIIRHFTEENRKLERELSLLMTGVNIKDYIKFMSLSPGLGLMAGGNLTTYRMNESVETRENAQWVHGFVLEIIIKWQIEGYEIKFPPFFRPAYEQLCDESLGA